MARPPDPREPPAAQRRRTVRGLPPIEVVLLVFAGGAAGLGIGLLLGSKAAAIGATLLGGVLVAVGTYRTIQVTREGQITTRFTQAVTQLDAKDSCGKRKEVIVLGGIYALERIAADSRLDYHPIMEILTSFIRMYARLPKSGASEEQGEESVPEPSNDIQAALAVLARRRSLPREHRLDLRGTDLRRAKLPHADFRRVIFFRADLRWADLFEADLRGAKLQGAKLRPSNVGTAKLEGAEYDAATTWPLDFDKEAARVILRDAR